MNICGGLVLTAACDGFPPLRDLHGSLFLTFPSTKALEFMPSINKGLTTDPTLILEFG